MTRLSVDTSSAMKSDQPQEINTRMRGIPLMLARSAWILVAVLSGIYFVTGIAVMFQQLQSVCSTAGCLLTPTSVRDLSAMGLSVSFFATYLIALAVIFASVSFAVGITIFWRKSDDRMVLFASFALVTFGATFIVRPSNVLTTTIPVWTGMVTIVEFLGQTSVYIFFFLFPDGRFIPRWMIMVSSIVVVLEFCFYVLPHSFIAQLFAAYGIFVSLSLFALVVFSQLYKYWRVSGQVQRIQTKWVVFGITLAVLGYAVGLLVYLFIGAPVLFVLIDNTIVTFTFLLVPLTIGIAMLRYRLWDIDILINRALVYGLLTAIVVGIYVLVVGSLGALFETRSNLLISLIATGLIAVLFQPLRFRLQRGINRLTYGDRDDPYAVLSRLGQRLEVALAPEVALSTIVETVAQALKLPYTAITMKQNNEYSIAASYGDVRGNLLHLPLIYQTEQVGELVLAPRSPGESFSAADKRLLSDLAHQVGVVVHAVRLTADLQRLTADVQRSREHLVMAREEERRRLRRDLHDGLGPTLAALALVASNVSDLIPIDPDAAISLTNELQNEIRATVGDIRRLVYELRPPALDDLGLVAAIRERAAQFSRSTHTSEGSGTAPALQVVVEAPDHLPPLPAAVEVAAYRIVQEAMTNVVRHAHAHTCRVRLSLTDTLRVEVIDDGIGLPPDYKAGVGLVSMHERATELGGSCIIEKNDEAGTCIEAILPLPRE